MCTGFPCNEKEPGIMTALRTKKQDAQHESWHCHCDRRRKRMEEADAKEMLEGEFEMVHSG